MVLSSAPLEHGNHDVQSAITMVVLVIIGSLFYSVHAIPIGYGLDITTPLISVASGTGIAQNIVSQYFPSILAPSTDVQVGTDIYGIIIADMRVSS